MALHQTVRRAFVPTGCGASVLGGGRYYSSMMTSTKLNHGVVATQRFTESFVVKTHHHAPSYRPFSSTKSGGGFVQWYESHLNSQPVLTKAITGSILWGLGDCVAQVVPPAFAKDDEGLTELAAPVKKEFVYDVLRTAKAVFYGFVIHAPLSHVHFNFLEWMTIKAGLQGLSITVFKTVMEQFVYWSWFSNSLYHGAMGLMNGLSLDQTYDRITEVLMPTQYAQWSFWIPVQLLNFQFVPVRHQLNVVLLTSVVWTALLSAWYPPEDKTVVEEEK